MGPFSPVLVVLAVLGLQANAPHEPPSLRLQPVGGPRWLLGQPVTLEVPDSCARAEYVWADSSRASASDFDLPPRAPGDPLVVVPRRSGSLRIAPMLERCPEGTRRTAPLVLSIDPVPSAGRPASYLGGVGTLEVALSADARSIVLGETLELVVELRGPGVYGSMKAPDLESWLRSERFLSVAFEPAERPRGDVRRYRVQLRPREAGPLRLPGLSVATFDPDSRQYLTARSQPLAVEVQRIPTWTPETVPDRLAGILRGRLARNVVVIGGAVAIATVASWFAWRTLRNQRAKSAGRGRLTLKQALYRIDSSGPCDEVAQALLHVIAQALDDAPTAPGVLDPDQTRLAVLRRTGDANLAGEAERFVGRIERLAYGRREGCAHAPEPEEAAALLSAARELLEPIARTSITDRRQDRPAG